MIRSAALERLTAFISATLLGSMRRVWRNRWRESLLRGHGRRGSGLGDEPAVDFGEFGEIEAACRQVQLEDAHDIVITAA